MAKPLTPEEEKYLRGWPADYPVESLLIDFHVTDLWETIQRLLATLDQERKNHGSTVP